MVQAMAAQHLASNELLPRAAKANPATNGILAELIRRFSLISMSTLEILKRALHWLFMSQEDALETYLIVSAFVVVFVVVIIMIAVRHCC
jgi:hypothetical protein